MDIKLIIMARDLLLLKEYKPQELHAFVAVMNGFEAIIDKFNKAEAANENKENEEKS